MRTAVNSSLLKAVAYNRATKVLQIEFKPRAGETTGKVYEYANVEQATYDAFVAAKSQGRYFLNEIKPGHPCTRVREEENAEYEANTESAKADAEAEAQQRADSEGI